MASKTPMPFPSVTVCTLTVFRQDFNFSRIPGFDADVHKRLLENCADDDIIHKMKKDFTKNYQAALRYVRDQSNEERFKLGLNLTKVIESCKFGPHGCNIRDPNDIYMYSDSVHGNCFTFNPAFDDTSAKTASTEDELSLKLKFPSKGYWLKYHTKATLTAQIHPPGTAPLIETQDVEHIFADAIDSFAVDLESEMVSLKKRTATIPSCVDDDDETYRRRSVHYNDQSPYRYSQKACLKSCKEEAFAACGLIYAHTPRQSEEYEKGKNITSSTNDCELKPITMEACDCPIPCSKTEYRIRRDEKELSNILCEGNPPPPTAKPPENKYGSSEYDYEVQMKVKFNSNIYQRMEEQLCYELSQYLGILGGNMSLWIGLCVISLLEVVELGIRVIVATVRPQRKKLQPNFSNSMVLRRPQPSLPRKPFHF